MGGTVVVVPSHIFPTYQTRFVNDNGGRVSSLFLMIIDTILLHKFDLRPRDENEFNIQGPLSFCNILLVTTGNSDDLGIQRANLYQMPLQLS